MSDETSRRRAARDQRAATERLNREAREANYVQDYLQSYPPDVIAFPHPGSDAPLEEIQAYHTATVRRREQAYRTYRAAHPELTQAQAWEAQDMIELRGVWPAPPIDPALDLSGAQASEAQARLAQGPPALVEDDDADEAARAATDVGQIDGDVEGREGKRARIEGVELVDSPADADYEVDDSGSSSGASHNVSSSISGSGQGGPTPASSQAFFRALAARTALGLRPWASQ
jgi:hypothetical protein